MIGFVATVQDRVIPQPPDVAEGFHFLAADEIFCTLALLDA
jgi:hypothetical protein